MKKKTILIDMNQEIIVLTEKKKLLLQMIFFNIDDKDFYKM